MEERRPMIAGNWKMNLTLKESAALAGRVCRETAAAEGVDVLIAPPFTALTAVREAIAGTRILLGAQNMHWEESGAYTGEISPSMLLNAGCSHVILGHSERRALFGETNETVDRKVSAALRVDLIPIVCFGETLEERERGRTFDVVKEQLQGSLGGLLKAKSIPHSTVLAYEPVWAIGTGRTATPAQAQEVHAFVRKWLIAAFDTAIAAKIRILYGGSVKPDNISELMSMPDIDGALVGGASLKAESFVPIVRYEKG
jgi:triosephosphate isomerase (TIM)